MNNKFALESTENVFGAYFKSLAQNLLFPGFLSHKYKTFIIKLLMSLRGAVSIEALIFVFENGTLNF